MAFRFAAALAATAVLATAGAASAASNNLCKGISTDPIEPSYVGGPSAGPNGEGYDFNNALDCLGVFNGADKSTTLDITDTVGTTATTATVGGDDLLGSVSTASHSFGRSEIEHNEFIINELEAFGFSDWDLVDEINNTGTDSVYTQNSAFAGAGYGLSATSLASQVNEGYRHNYIGTWTVADFQTAQRAAIVMLNEADQWAIYLIDGVEAQTGYWTTNQNDPQATDGWLKVEAKSYGYNLTSMQLFISTATTDVPVPAAAPLLLAGLGAMAWIRRRKA